jgi:hypothetical protein
MKPNRAMLIVLLAGVATGAFAARVRGPSGDAPPGPNDAPIRSPAQPPERVVKAAAAAASQSDDSMSLRSGKIAAVSEKGDQILVNGSWLAVDASRTLFVRERRQVGARDALVTGQAVRFTLLPGAANKLTLGVVYVP